MDWEPKEGLGHQAPIYVVATRALKAGEELVTDYGEHFGAGP